MVFPVGMGIAFVVFIVTLALFRYVSLASMLGAIALPVSALVLQRPIVLVVVTAVIALFVILRHRTNISRLLAGTESKVGQKAAPAANALPKT
jgi:glycerol-3-phosphate acyltransferase PlsY